MHPITKLHYNLYYNLYQVAKWTTSTKLMNFIERKANQAFPPAHDF